MPFQLSGRSATARRSARRGFSQPARFWYYGLLQLATGTAGMLAMVLWKVGPPYSLYLVALCFGVYQIAFGIWMTRKHR